MEVKIKNFNLLITSIIITFMFLSCNPEKSDINSVNISGQVNSHKNNTDTKISKEYTTRGTVEAIMNAFTTCGCVVLYKSYFSNSNARFFSPFGEGEWDKRASIRPIDPWNGAHLRVDEWHVILLALSAGGNSFYTYQNAFEDLSTSHIIFTLNGEVIETEQTPIKRYLQPIQGFDVMYGYQVGKIYCPDELPVGTYTLNVVIKTPGFEDYTKSIIFYVDPIDANHP